MEQILSTYWPQLIAVVSLTVWLVRLEGKIRYNEQSLEMVNEHKSQISEVKEHLVEIKTDLRWMKESMKKGKVELTNN
jgi:hypothetical protein